MAKQFSFQSHDVMFCICQLASVNVHSLQETGDVARHLQDLRVVEFLKILHFPEVVWRHKVDSCPLSSETSATSDSK